jgi:hypothetical protein
MTGDIWILGSNGCGLDKVDGYVLMRTGSILPCCVRFFVFVLFFGCNGKLLSYASGDDWLS